MSSDKPYIFRTTFTPIHGLDDDLAEFIQRFERLKTVRFTHFCELWRHQKFIHLIYARITQSALCDILGCIFHRLVDFVQPAQDRTQLARVAALYLLYAFHGKQPMKNQVRIRVCPETWSGLTQLSTEAKEEGHLDVYYVFRLMCASNAFAFCANRQVLYPGVPLFSSPQVFLTDNDVQTGGRKMLSDPHSLYLTLLKLGKFPGADYNAMFKCLDSAVSQYVTAKSSLNSEDVEDSIGGGEAASVQHASGEEFLPGLNFITHPDSLKNLSDVLEQLDKQGALARQSLTPAEQPTGFQVSSHSPGQSVITRNVRRLDAMNRRKIKRKRLVVAMPGANDDDYDDDMTPSSNWENLPVPIKEQKPSASSHGVHDVYTGTRSIRAIRCPPDACTPGTSFHKS